jgi:hypothetical protein
VNARALFALVLQIVFLAAPFGWRMMVHRRRTGDSGFRWQRHDRTARVSGAMFAAAVVARTVGVALAAFSVTDLWGALDGRSSLVACARRRSLRRIHSRPCSHSPIAGTVVGVRC